jgi:hypothetical protein
LFSSFACGIQAVVPLLRLQYIRKIDTERDKLVPSATNCQRRMSDQAGATTSVSPGSLVRRFRFGRLWGTEKLNARFWRAICSRDQPHFFDDKPQDNSPARRCAHLHSSDFLHRHLATKAKLQVSYPPPKLWPRLLLFLKRIIYC